MKRDILDNPFEYGRRHGCFLSEEPWPLPEDGPSRGSPRAEVIGGAIGGAAGAAVGVGVSVLCSKAALLATTALGTVLAPAAAAFVVPIVVFGAAAALAITMHQRFRQLNKDAPGQMFVARTFFATQVLGLGAWMYSWRFLGISPELAGRSVLGSLPAGLISAFAISNFASAGMELGRAAARGRVRFPRLTPN